MHSARDAKMTAMLQRARDQFQFYGDHHMLKPVPQTEKASVNYGFVAEINEVLLTPHPTIHPGAYKIVDGGFDYGDYGDAIPQEGAIENRDLTSQQGFGDYGIFDDAAVPQEGAPLRGDDIQLDPPGLGEGQVDGR